MAHQPQYAEVTKALYTLSTLEIPFHLERHGLSLNEPQGFSPMHYTAGDTGRANIMRFFLQQCGGDPETVFEGKTLLETACLAGKETIIFILLAVLPCYHLEQEQKVLHTLATLPACLRVKTESKWKYRVSSCRRLAFLFITSKQVLRLPPSLIRECVLFF